MPYVGALLIYYIWCLQGLAALYITKAVLSESSGSVVHVTTRHDIEFCTERSIVCGKSALCAATATSATCTCAPCQIGTPFGPFEPLGTWGSFWVHIWESQLWVPRLGPRFGDRFAPHNNGHKFGAM